MSEIQCVELPPEHAVQFWPDLLPYIDAALVYDFTRSTSPAEILAQLEQGLARCLLCARDDAILSATIIQMFRNQRDERVLHITATAGGEADEWMPVLFDAVKEICAAESCDAITLQGRPGWARKLNRFGFKTELVSMRLETNGRDHQRQVAANVATGSVQPLFH